jgi:hypothetical protein
MRKTLFVSILLFSFITIASAQWRCKSEIGTYQKPISKKVPQLTWSFELMVSGAYIDHHVATNDFGILALNFQHKKHKIYLEGGVKVYDIYDFKNKLNTYYLRPGAKEFFYQYSDKKLGRITLGMHSMRSNDEYLLNERAVGITYKLPLKVGAITLNAGSVKKDFSINGTFCTTGYLYDIMPERVRQLGGNGLGQTNFTLISYDFKPERKKKVVDEFGSEDEFASTDEPNKYAPKVNNLGVVGYTEFGSWIPKPVSLGGIYANIDLGAGIFLSPELLYQHYQDSLSTNLHGLVYAAKLVKRFNWKTNHQTQINLYYFGFHGFTENTIAMNSFSNIFGGTILRLDAPELPFIKTGIRHIFPKDLKSSFFKNLEFKLFGTTQMIKDGMWEFDFEVGKTFHTSKLFKMGIMINLQYAYMFGPFDGALLPYRGANMVRLECRFTL